MGVGMIVHSSRRHALILLLNNIDRITKLSGYPLFLLIFRLNLRNQVPNDFGVLGASVWREQFFQFQTKRFMSLFQLIHRF